MVGWLAVIISVVVIALCVANIRSLLIDVARQRESTLSIGSHWVAALLIGYVGTYALAVACCMAVIFVVVT